MTSNASAASTYPVCGAAALAPRGRALTLLEGGLSSGRAGARAAERPGALGARQTIAAIVAGALVVLAVCGASALADALRARSAADALAARGTETVTVAAGDTLWGIAEARSGRDLATRDVVSWIEDANSLDGAAIAPGQRLLVPASS